jgi:hypothetical protein
MAMFFRLRRCLPALLLFFAFARSAGAQSAGAAHIAGEADFGTEAPSLFPQAFFNSYLEARDARDASQSYGAATEAEFKALSLPSYREPILLNNDILAFYGHPRSRNMGILGRYTKEELNEMLDILALEYRKAGGRNVYKALYIIFGTVWPGGEIGIIQESLLREYIDFALEKNMLVFIDHQIGRYTPADSVKKMLPWLKYPNVHLALDPEWRTTRPMVEIGTVTADEINQVQRIMEDYMIENRIPGERFLVIHQFNYIMISNRERVVSNFSKVTLIHCADGFGAPHVKKSSYANNAKATNMPIKAFKLFYNFNIPGAGYDYPLLTPKEVFELKPRPYIVMYQ